MTHLGDDVAAFVDGQLPGSAAESARRHLEDCGACRQAVRQQEALKARMRSAGGPSLPPQLLASLAQLPQARIVPEPWWRRVARSRWTRAGGVALGASVAVLAAAFVLGAPGSDVDEVAPSYDSYVGAFGSSVSAVSTSARPIDDAQMDELTASGWPCHRTLAGDLRREHAAQDASSVALTYSNGRERLRLYEQHGRLDEAAVRDFRRRTIAGAPVWVRDGVPVVVTWDVDGVVYTVVTDADAERVERTVAQLPTPVPVEQDPLDRVGAGLTRMAGWLDDAA